MTHEKPKSGRAITAGVLALLLSGCGCQQMSERVEDRSLGMNGGFEHVSSALPVNWLVYTPETVPTGSFAIDVDTVEYREGAQSLRFDVQECSDGGGWGSPGIAQEIPAEVGVPYRVGFWIKNEGCDWTVTYGGVAPKIGEATRIRSADAPGDAWQRIEREYTMPAPYEKIRFELSITSPGRLWIDGVTVERAE